MQKLLAIAGLTWKAAFRFRLFWVLLALLLAAVMGLPMLLKDDGTARGFTQILITYTLSAITGLLGLCTLWLACGTLARDIEEAQIQMVAVKPIARWQIWLGKWLGLMSLNAVLLAIAGASVYGLLQWRATRLVPEERQKLRNEVLVARGSAKERSWDKEIEATTEQMLQKGLTQNPDLKANIEEARKQLRERVKSEYQVVRAGDNRMWKIDLSHKKNEMRDKPLYLRIKFQTAEGGGSLQTFGAFWVIGEPDRGKYWQTEMPSLAGDTVHEFQIPPNLLDEDGVLTVTFFNPNSTTLLFPLDEGLEVLYPEGSFTLNYARGLAIILCWMALLAALGLASASFLSFPVAAFFSLALLAIALSSGTLANVVEQNSLMGGNEEGSRSILDIVFVPIFRGLLEIVNLAKNFSPISSLSTGRSIPWSQVTAAIGQIVFLLGGIFIAGGILVFNRRELARAQTQ
jgi:hypothetical protein